MRMDPSTRINENSARRAIEEERQARPVEYLSDIQKKVLIEISKTEDSDYIVYKQGSPEASSLDSLSTLGLVKKLLGKGGVSGRLTDKGRLLLYNNPKLKFAPPEGARWIITTVISVLALIVATIAMIRTF